ncbi:carbohydrate ABC transporter permease [Brachybacterium kimchii]|uniref:Carbohydrate ABC transporter permease n=1 Tax=Brachybacterium kimchii TaxID=2942909 RepID=A0ABY4N4T0_9MICO|nr:carbohydrate ABC transporter permease [Brachybacterium kimchii]UQN28777.1 carbohydrate ABC transporter permease [Brachybacterium kimchii]
MLEARTRLGRLGLQALVTVLVIPFLIPLIAMIQGSLQGIGWRNYLVVLSLPQLPLFFRNSLIIAGLTILLVYLCTMLASFGFAKLHIHGKEFFFWLLLAALTLPEIVLVTPLFVTASVTNIYNTYWAVVLPLAALQIPFAVLLTRTFIAGIPDALVEAARIDGASTFQAFKHVVLPLTRPIAAAIIVLTLVGTWNSYLLPLLFLQDASSQVVTQVPSFYQGQYNDDQTKILASAVITGIPGIVAYLCLQRQFERGLSAGAVK